MGIFKKHKKALVTYDTKPPKGGMIWINQETGTSYVFDSIRGKWLSTAKDVFEFARKGSASGMYLPLLGDLDHAEDVYMTGYDACVTEIFCRSKTADFGKTFYIIKNGTPIHQFVYTDNTYTYINTDLDITIGAYDEMNVYVSGGKGKVKNTVCRVTLARRYDNV